MLLGDRSREELEENLEEVLEYLSFTNFNEIRDFFMNRNYSRSLVTKMLTDTVYLKTMSDFDLYLLTTQAYQYVKDNDKEMFRVEKYFTKHEIEEAKNYKKVNETDNSNVIIFTDVIETNKNQYTCAKVPLQTIASIINRGLYGYDYNIQRQAKKKVRRERISKTPTIIQSKKRAIVETIMNNKPLGNYTISIVIPSIGENDVIFNEDKRTLQVEVNEHIRFLVADGFHRWIAASDVLELNPDIDYNLIFEIYNIPMDSAEELVSNIDKQTKFSELRTKVKNKEDLYMVMANEINNYGTLDKNLLFHKLGEDMVEVNYAEAYTTLSIFADAIRYNFDEKMKLSTFERAKIKKFLLDGFVYIIGMFEKEFKNKKVSKKNSVITHQNTFIGYIAILSKLYGDSDWEVKILDTLTDINFSKENSKWNEIELLNENITKAKLKSISNYFRELVR